MLQPALQKLQSGVPTFDEFIERTMSAKLENPPQLRRAYKQVYSELMVCMNLLPNIKLNKVAIDISDQKSKVLPLTQERQEVSLPKQP